MFSAGPHVWAKALGSLVRAAGLHLLSHPLGIFMLLLIFFAFLHCWLNAFAEMLRFGDRMFYRVRPGLGASSEL